MEERAGDYSTLQHVLQLSYSQDPEDQQKAAIELSKLVNGAVFPAYSFGPLSNAITVLLPSSNRTVVSYSARALKIMLLDDALRPQTIIAGVPAAVCTAIKQWEDEILCLRELLGALQTLCWDKQCVKGVLQADIIGNLIEYITEVSVLALATLSNILSYSDTLLLADITTVESLGKGMPALLDALKASSQKPQRLYAAAAIANASFHPRLVAVLNEHGGVQLCRDMERQSLANLHIVGSKLGECLQTALYRLSDKREGDPKLGNAKYSFKWGTKPVMELSLAPYAKNSTYITICFVIWVCIVLFTFMPLLFA